MRKNVIWRNKLDENGKPIFENGDFVMELVSEEELPDVVLPPNWLSLEQTLRYFNGAALFSKAFANATDKGFGLFLATLANGKRGDATENALAFAFSVLGVTWTSEEKDQINQILTDNNFTIQI